MERRNWEKFTDNRGYIVPEVISVDVTLEEVGILCDTLEANTPLCDLGGNTTTV